MKIAFFTDMFLPHLNGVTTALLNQVLGLSRQGHRIYIFAPKAKTTKPIKYKVENVHVEYMPSFPIFVYPEVRFSYPIFNQAYRVTKKFRPDIIHFQSPSSAGIAGIITAKQLGIPLVGTFHGYFMEPEYLKVIGFADTFQKITTNVLWKYTTFYFNLADGVVTPSEISRKELITRGFIKDISVIHNSLDTQTIKKVSPEKVAKLKKKLKLREHVILYVGRISHEKNIDQLIKSFKLVLKKEPDTHLLIIGKGPALPLLKDLVGSLGLKKDVIFHGEVEQKPLLTEGYYQMVDMFATASTSELQPVSLIEAYAFGLPAVGSAKRGTGEMIKNVGLLSKPDDIEGFARNLLKIISDEKLKNTLSANSLKAFNNKYELGETTHQFEKYYQQFI